MEKPSPNRLFESYKRTLQNNVPQPLGMTQESRLIKLIWDFRGPHAEQTAKHHAIHLEEFAQKNKLEKTSCSSEKMSEMHTIASIIILPSDLDLVKNSLRPHRGIYLNHE